MLGYIGVGKNTCKKRQKIRQFFSPHRLSSLFKNQQFFLLRFIFAFFSSSFWRNHGSSFIPLWVKDRALSGVGSCVTSENRLSEIERWSRTAPDPLPLDLSVVDYSTVVFRIEEEFLYPQRTITDCKTGEIHDLKSKTITHVPGTHGNMNWGLALVFFIVIRGNIHT